MSEEKTLVEVKHLKQYFDINMGMFKTKPLKAVDDISFTIKKGETLGLVGESGCGRLLQVDPYSTFINLQLEKSYLTVRKSISPPCRNTGPRLQWYSRILIHLSTLV